MSKELEEIIALLENAVDTSEKIDCTDAGGEVVDSMDVVDIAEINPIIDRLRTLAKPVQYVVEIKKFESHNCEDSIAYLNGHVFYIGTEHEIRQYSHEFLSTRRAMFALPPITIEQITFVEV